MVALGDDKRVSFQHPDIQIFGYIVLLLCEQTQVSKIWQFWFEKMNVASRAFRTDLSFNLPYFGTPNRTIIYLVLLCTKYILPNFTNFAIGSA